jgi:hypothetical protein
MKSMSLKVAVASNALVWRRRWVQVVELKKIHDEIGPAAEFLRAHIKGSLQGFRLSNRT